MAVTIGTPKVSWGKTKKRSQMFLVITHDGRLVERQFQVSRSCALTDNKDAGFLLSPGNQFRDKQNVTWQLVDENSYVPPALREDVNIKDFDGLLEKIFADNHEERERQNYRDAAKNILADRLLWIMAMPCITILIIALIVWKNSGG